MNAKKDFSKRIWNLICFLKIHIFFHYIEEEFTVSLHFSKMHMPTRLFKKVFSHSKLDKNSLNYNLSAWPLNLDGSLVKNN